jgi:hypothetical protein
MITLQDYTDYFRQIATQHKSIAGFLKLSTKNLSEATEAVRNAKFEPGSIVLILENFEIAQQAPNQDQCFDIATGLFSIFQLYNARDKYDLETIGEDTLKICRQIEARMWRDAQRPQYDCIKKLQKGSFEFEPCHAPVLNGFGWRVFFDFAEWNSMEYNAEEWSDE